MGDKVKETLFKPGSFEENHFLLARHLPIGRCWENSFSTKKNLGKLIASFALEFYKMQLITEKISSEFDIDKTIDLLEDWEKSVGLPNKCFDRNTSIQRRRLQIKLIFNNFNGVQSKEDFVRVAYLFGFNIQVLSGSQLATFGLTFPLYLSLDTKAATHSLYIRFIEGPDPNIFFPLPFPLPFYSDGKNLLQCIFDKLAPANVKVIFI